MKIEETRIERFSNLREQIQREIDLEQVLLQQEQLLNDYVMRFNMIDNEYFQQVLQEVNEEWNVWPPHLQQNYSKNLINLETRYKINQCLSEINNKFDYDLNENISLQKILADSNNYNNYKQYLRNDSNNHYKEMLSNLENAIKKLQIKIGDETKLTQNLIKEHQLIFKTKKTFIQSNSQPVLEILSVMSSNSDEVFNRLTNKYKTGFKRMLWLNILIIISIIAILIFLLLIIVLFLF